MARNSTKMNGRAMLNSQRRDSERLHTSRAVLASSAIGRLWSR